MVDAHEGSGVLAQLLIKGAFGDALGRTGPTRDRVAEQHAHCLVELGNASVKMSADSRFHREWACLYGSFESYRKRAVADSKKKAILYLTYPRSRLILAPYSGASHVRFHPFRPLLPQRGSG